MNAVKRSPLDLSVESLASIGPKRAAALSRAGIDRIEDLLYYFPRDYLDRSSVTRIRDLHEDMQATVVGRIIQTEIKQGRRKRFILVLSDDTSLLTCVWFTHLSYWQKKFVVGEWLAYDLGLWKYDDSVNPSHVVYDITTLDTTGFDLVAVVIQANGGKPYVNVDNIQLTQVPEPCSLLLAGMGFLGLVFFGRRRRN